VLCFVITVARAARGGGGGAGALHDSTQKVTNRMICTIWTQKRRIIDTIWLKAATPVRIVDVDRRQRERK
jgi:hypothetical protein